MVAAAGEREGRRPGRRRGVWPGAPGSPAPEEREGRGGRCQGAPPPAWGGGRQGCAAACGRREGDVGRVAVGAEELRHRGEGGTREGRRSGKGRGAQQPALGISAARSKRGTRDLAGAARKLAVEAVEDKAELKGKKCKTKRMTRRNDGVN